MNNLIVFALHRQESAHIKEWLDYHLLVGVEKFFLRDNNSPGDPATLEILQPYIDKGIVVNTPLVGKAAGQQSQAYTEFIESRPDAKWVAFIDIDEFLCPVLSDSVPDALAEFDDFAGVGINWRCFGTSDCIKSPEYVTASNYRRSYDHFPPNAHIKSIVRPERVTHCTGPHSFAPKEGFSIVNENHQSIPYAFSSPPSYTKLYINHYMLRSEEDYALKASRGGGNSDKRTTQSNVFKSDRFVKFSASQLLKDPSFPQCHSFFWKHNVNHVEDHSLAERFLTRLKSM